MKLTTYAAIVVRLFTAQSIWAAPTLSTPIRSFGKTLTLNTTHVKGSALKKRQFINAPIAEVTGSFYVATVFIGDTQQVVNLELDTGSADTWVFSPSACKASKGCAYDFDPAASGTYQAVSSGNFYVKYADETWASGDFFTDNVSFDAETTVNVQLGLANNFNNGVTGANADAFVIGTLGVGPSLAEWAVINNNESPYPNIIDQLASQNVIDARVYGLWLDDFLAGKGKIMFGGWDTTKIDGDLTWKPIVADDNGAISAYRVTLDGFGVNGQVATPTETTVLLDSGSQYTSLPTDVYKDILLALPFYPDDAMQNCPKLDGTLDFYFNDLAVKVPFSEIVIFDFADENSPCSFGLVDGGSDGGYILGDSFLRSAYVVYDLDQGKIGLANTVFT